MVDRGEAPNRALAQRRERTVEVLCDQFARDALDMEEFERRLDSAHRARSVDELRELLADLPGGAGAVEPSGSGDVSSVRPLERVPASAVPERRTVVAVCGGNSRKGSWVPARKTLCVAICGGIELDFREARLPAGVTEVNVMAVMGGVEVIVPPGTYVESGGLAIMGGFENMDEHAIDPGPHDPIIRVRGLAVMGGLEVTVRHPGESARDARRRRKEERRRRRKELPGA